MTTETNKSIISKLFQLFEKGGTGNVVKYFPSNWVNHDPSLPPMSGFEGAKQLIGVWNAISNLKVTIEDSVAEGERVAVRFRMSGTQTGSFMGITPSGKTIDVGAFGIFRILDGKVTNNWVVFDALGMLQQLGAIPVPEH